MAPTRTEDEELSFMDDILSGMDTFASASDSSNFSKRKSLSSKHTDSVLKTPIKAKAYPPPSIATPRSARKRATPVKTSGVDDVLGLLEGVEDWDWDDMNSDFMTPKKQKMAYFTAPENPVLTKAEMSTRCIVKLVELIDTTDCYEKILTVHAVSEEEIRHVILQDDWVETDIRVGDVINAIGTFVLPPSSSSSSPLHTITITSRQNLLILHPDILITATALSNAPQCRRKPLLSTLVRSSTDITPSLVWGNMLHEVMQMCLRNNSWDEHRVNSEIANVVKRGLGDLLSINIGVEQAEHEVKARANGLKAFSTRYISQMPKSDAVLTDTRSRREQKALLAITDLHDVEEDIWSPTFGLKGKIDASVQAVVTETEAADSPFKKALRNAPEKTTDSPMPFEIKTGRATAGMEHRAQTMLYTLLLAERYKTDVPSGLLYYTQSEEVVRVPAARNEIKALVLARNEMAGYMMRRVTKKGDKTEVSKAAEDSERMGPDIEAEPFLPRTIDDSRICGKCYTLDTCMLYRKAVENVVDESSEIADMYALKTSHLTPAHTSFFKKWEALLSFEEQDLLRFRKELWTMRAIEREERGRCFSSMILDTTYRPSPDALKALSKRESKIHQHTYRFMKSESGISSLLSGHMSLGDAITVSVEPDLLALARGFIVGLTPKEVILGVDHVLDLKKIGIRKACPASSVVFRIDKDELFGGMARVRENLARLFYAEGDTRRLKLVVDLDPPQFADWSEEMLPTIHSNVAQEIKNLNVNQRLAARHVLRAQDYALILGMPGTGKTTVIATIIRALVHMNKTVLLTSHTHSAVDTILMKLKDKADFSILRLGSVDKIHPEVHGFTLAARQPAASVEQLEQQIMSPAVVATTCLAIDQKGGLDVSLFRRLSDAHPAAVVDLNEQYRMNEDIMTLSNHLIYSGRLRCGNEETARRALLIPNRDFVRSLHSKESCGGESCWLGRLLDPRSASCKAVFVDTDDIPAHDSRVGDLTENITEAYLVHQFTEYLILGGVEQRQIGVISLYRQQIKLLSYLLQEWKDVDILTADRSQGRDKDCIIISMVRSNDQNQIGDLVKDWRRMNVAFTRARSKLVIFGSRKTLQSAPLLGEFFTLMDKQGWILRLPKDADQMHASTAPSPNKRGPGEALDEGIETKRTPKKVKTSAFSDGLLRGRPILKDLVNGET
ncbi:Dna2-domain-containing protein [Cristinia sonorae]|uniref:DNA replication ATP-dependent helicase/nuclease n=1 Tax=Cristinia sonorae TaxID=1940300 RepID=A0A8K0UKG3_9AGAR|nr:Dna2-domain-containing protein [Cristinia sonorae]